MPSTFLLTQLKITKYILCGLLSNRGVCGYTLTLLCGGKDMLDKNVTITTPPPVR